ncbi:MAG: nitroreductase family protein [Bacteroidales bacterium]
MNKDALNIYPLHPLLKKRWSPRAYNDREIELWKLQSVFEAARWSPSGANQQPWRFIVGFKGDETFTAIFNTLDEYNQVWANNAPVMVLTIGRNVLNAKDVANVNYRYDLGQSVAHLSIQATELGLYVHQMGGFNTDAARTAFNIPDQYDPATVFVLGYMGEIGVLDEYNQKREVMPRERMAFDEFIFTGTFGKSTNLFK